MLVCATCHAVHDTVAYPGKQMVGGKSVGTQVLFLRRDNAESAMCADCHVNRLQMYGVLFPVDVVFPVSLIALLIYEVILVRINNTPKKTSFL